MKSKNTQSTPKITKNILQEKPHKIKNNLVKTDVLGIGITNETPENILEYIINCIENSEENFYIVTPNPEIIVYANHHNDFVGILRNAKIALNDGIGNGIAARLLGKRLTSRLTGVDSMKMLCEKVSNRPITVGFLGGGPKIAEMTSECLRGLFPNLKIAFVNDEWNEEGFTKAKKYQVVQSVNRQPLSIKGKVSLSSQERGRVRSFLPASRFPLPAIDILFVAFGFPKQEEWMATHLNHIPVRVMMGVGGAFDYVSGNVPRAPQVLRVLGLEWLYRLIRQPWRWKRQLALLEFAWLVLREKFQKFR